MRPGETGDNTGKTKPRLQSHVSLYLINVVLIFITVVIKHVHKNMHGTSLGPHFVVMFLFFVQYVCVVMNCQVCMLFCTLVCCFNNLLHT